MEEDFDAQKSLREVHLSTLSGQSSIYCSSLIPTNGLRRGPERFLVSSLEKNLRIYTAASNSVEYQEKMYAYLPQGCEVISMDLFCDGSTLVTGITWSASNNESPAYFFNSYESNMDYESLTCTSSVELFDWVPFQITHCTFGSSVCFIVSGSDGFIHLFKKDLASGAYLEYRDLITELPEFTQNLDSIALWVAFQYLESTRITAIAQECGTLIVYIVDTDSVSVVQKHTLQLEGPLTKVCFLRNSTDLVVISSLVPSRVFYNTVEHGLKKSALLPFSDEFDVPTCCTTADIVSCYHYLIS